MLTIMTVVTMKNMEVGERDESARPFYTVKPVCNDHLYNKIFYLWYIQYCV